MYAQLEEVSKGLARWSSKHISGNAGTNFLSQDGRHSEENAKMLQRFTGRKIRIAADTEKAVCKAGTGFERKT